MNEPLPLPPALASAFAIGAGLIVGSFLNVVIARLPHGQSLARPRSRCPGCGAAIAAYDNVPVLSYLLLRGRCRSCRAPISVRYPVVELLTALLFQATHLKFGLTPLLLARDWPFVSLLVAITFIDLDLRIIPDRLSLPGLLLGLATAALTPGLGLLPALAGAALGFGLFYGMAWLYLRLTGRSGLGGGDVKLLAMLGAFVGPLGVLVTVMVSSIVGSVAGIAWGVAHRAEGGIMKSAIPFGPFLVVGALYYYLLNDFFPLLGY
jgi:leader peptidase (prepilin peptidase) / N-methyltransferase